MIERGRGHIIAINSSAGLVPNTQMVPYCAAKYGLRGSFKKLYIKILLIS